MSAVMRREVWLFAVLGLLVFGCGTASVTQAPPPDHPVPPSEPRGVVSARVDLPPARDCEEAFDLAMYRNRAIQLIEWDERVGKCEQRRIDIRFLSRRIARDEVIETARRNALRMTVMPKEDSNDDATK